MPPGEALLYKGIQQQIESPPGDDPVIRTLFQRLAQEDPESPLGVAMREAATYRWERSEGKLSESELAGTMRMAICTYLISCGNDFSYDDMHCADDWNEPFTWVNAALADDNENRANEQLRFNLQFGHVQTNISDRYKFIELLMQTSGRAKDGVRWLDIGSGLGQGVQRAFYKEDFPMEYDGVGYVHENLRPKQAFYADMQLTEAANYFLGLPGFMSQTSSKNGVATYDSSAVCVDLEQIFRATGNKFQVGFDPAVLARSLGSLRPGEYTNETFMRRYTDLVYQDMPRMDQYDELLRNPQAGATLQNNKAPNSTYVRADLSDPEELEDFISDHGNSFNLITRVTSDHQMAPSQRQRMDAHANRLLSDDGFLVVIDFAKLKRGYPSAYDNIAFFRDWHSAPLRYRAMVKDARNYDQYRPAGYREAARFVNSRCGQVALTGFEIEMNGTIQTFTQTLKNNF